MVIVLFALFIVIVLVLFFTAKHNQAKAWAEFRSRAISDNLFKRFPSGEVSDGDLQEEHKRLDGLYYPYHKINARLPYLVHRFLTSRYSGRHGFRYPFYSRDTHPWLYILNRLESGEWYWNKPFPAWLVRGYGETTLRAFRFIGLIFKPFAILHYYLLRFMLSLEWKWHHYIVPNANRYLEPYCYSKMRWIADILMYREQCAPLNGSTPGLWYYGDKLRSDWMFFISFNPIGHLLHEANFIAAKELIREKVEENPELEDQWDIEMFSGNGNPEHIILQVFADEDVQRLTPLPLAVWAIEEIKEKLDDYPVLDEELFSNMEIMEAYDVLYEDTRSAIDTERMPSGTDWDQKSLYYSGDKDLFPNDSERPAWVYELYSAMYDAGYRNEYGDSGNCYRHSDVIEALYRLGWMVDLENLYTYDRTVFQDEVDTSLPRLAPLSDPDDYKHEDTKWRWHTYYSINELRTTGDGKYYSPDYFEQHIQKSLALKFEED